MNIADTRNSTVKPAGPSFPASRKSRSAQKSYEVELQRLHSMSIEGRVREALGMEDSFAWLIAGTKSGENHRPRGRPL